MLHDEAAHLVTTTVQSFKTDGLLGTKAAPAVLTFLFHPVEDPLGGSHSPLIVDEGWQVLDDVVSPTPDHPWLKTRMVLAVLC